MILVGFDIARWDRQELALLRRTIQTRMLDLEGVEYDLLKKASITVTQAEEDHPWTAQCVCGQKAVPPRLPNLDFLKGGYIATPVYHMPYAVTKPEAYEFEPMSTMTMCSWVYDPTRGRWLNYDGI